LTNLSVLPIGIAKQAVKKGADIVSGRGVKSNVPMMMSDSHFTSALFQVTGDRRTRRVKNGNFTSFRDATVQKIFRFKGNNFVTGKTENVGLARIRVKCPLME
jgi:hypothetical protein